MRALARLLEIDDTTHFLFHRHRKAQPEQPTLITLYDKLIVLENVLKYSVML